MKTNVYQQITDKIIAAIESGAGDFVMPWHRPAGNGIPWNPSRKGYYNGCNAINLWIEAHNRGFTSCNFATLKQWNELGAQVRKGEKSATVVFYKPLTVKDRNAPADSDETTEILMARAYHVFNADQVEGWTAPTQQLPTVQNPAEIMANVEAFVRNTGADVRTGEARAYYVPSRDFINMPPRELFTGSPTSTPTETYYSTLLHELTHWTGAEHRLKRDLNTRFGKAAYAAEELVAELGAAFLCASLGIANDPRPDHAQYLASWLKVLKDDSRAIFTAASKAQQAADYLHKLQTAQLEAPAALAA